METNLIIADETMLTICRRKCGRGFAYYAEGNTLIRDRETLKRIRQLVIPPMWNEVLISCEERTHIQAVGRDLKNRKQYIYHESWTEQQQREKFEKLGSFVRKLPEFRAFCLQNLKSKTLSRKKVLSIVCLILDEYGIRVGNAQYARSNESYGLATIRRKHLHMESDELHLKFKGKSHQYLDIAVSDPKLAELIRECSEKPGYEIFKYREGSNWVDVDSQDINEFIHEHLSPEISSKYFRTWVACRNAIEYYPQALRICTENPRKKLLPTLIKLVADSIGNTVSVCRKYYIHPVILEAAEEQQIPLIEQSEHSIEERYSEAEKVALELIG